MVLFGGVLIAKGVSAEKPKNSSLFLTEANELALFRQKMNGVIFIMLTTEVII